MNSFFMLIFIATSCVLTHQSRLNIVYAIELEYLLALKSKRLIHGLFHLTNEYLIHTLGFSIFPDQWPDQALISSILPYFTTFQNKISAYMLPPQFFANPLFQQHSYFTQAS